MTPIMGDLKQWYWKAQQQKQPMDALKSGDINRNVGDGDGEHKGKKNSKFT